MASEFPPGEIVVHRPTTVLASAHILADDEFDRVWRMSKALAASGMFKDVRQAEQAFGRILLGRDLGLSPTQSLMGLDVVEGNIQMRGVLLAGFVRQHEDYDYEIVSLTDPALPVVGEKPTAEQIAEEDRQHATIRFFRRDRVTGEFKALAPDITYSVAQARKLKSFKPGMPWFTARRNMLMWRALSDGVKFHCPDLLAGMPVYTEADSFDSTAVEIASGEGDGTEPGWEGLTDEMVAEVEALIEVAATFGSPVDRASVQMRLNHRPEAVEAWLEEEKARLADRQDVQVEEAQQALDTEPRS